MKKICLVRHAESQAQTGEEFSLDSSLSHKGREQSVKLGGVLAGIEFEKIFLSPLKRSRETFELTGLPREQAVFDSRLVEAMPAGLYDLILPYNKIEYGTQDRHDAWNIPAEARVAEFLDDMYSIRAKTVIVFAHGIVLNYLLRIFMGCSASKSGDKYCMMDNAAFSLICLDSEKNIDKLELWNCQDHLNEHSNTLKKMLKS